MKRLTMTDYALTLFFIFMLVLAVGAFFYGLKIGQEKTALKYEEMLKPKELPQELPSYHQQYLVSFYHTIYLPYRDFQKKWFEHLEDIELQNKTVEPSALLKELRKLADEKYKVILTSSMPSSSTLLKEGQNNYLKSLKLFLNAISGLKNIDQMSGKEIVAHIDKDPYFQEAKNFALSAQKNYYSAMEQWFEMTSPAISGKDILSNPKLSVKQWNQLSLTAKNNYIAELLFTSKQYVVFYPQDLTIRVDDLIQSGQAQSMKLTEINKMTDMLINTGAVRLGDFTKSKNKFYADASLPLLPFFFE